MPTPDLHLITTGADSNHFANLRVLVGSWLVHMQHCPLMICDFGLAPLQRQELTRIQGLTILPSAVPIEHPWLGKSLIGRFLAERSRDARTIMWLDADALFNTRLPDLSPLIEGYDMLLDAHIQSIGDIATPENIAALSLRPDDAYFSAGWWVARPGCLLDTYERFTALVRGQGHLWECDAFVAAIYAERLRIRPVSGPVWHVRGRTSLHSCTTRDGVVFHGEQPAYVVHANDGYTERSDGRRVFKRAELAEIQDFYEAAYRREIGQPIAEGTLGPNAYTTGR